MLLNNTVSIKWVWLAYCNRLTHWLTERPGDLLIGWIKSENFFLTTTSWKTVDRILLFLINLKKERGEIPIEAEVERQGWEINLIYRQFTALFTLAYTRAHTLGCFIFIKVWVPLQRLLSGTSGIGERREVKRDVMRADEVRGCEKGEGRTQEEEMRVKEKMR